MANNSYQKFFIKTLIILGISLLILTVLLLCIGKIFVGKYVYDGVGYSIHYWIETKTNRAKELDKKGNKIVFLSGSNTLYGLDSKYASEKTGLPVLNYGTHAGFGPYLFYDAKSIIKKGDIVILALEPDFYKKDKDWEISPDILSYLISYDKKYYEKANIKMKFAIIHHMLSVCLLNPKIKSASEWDKEIDAIKAELNEYGDLFTTEDILESVQKRLNGATIEEDIPKNLKEMALYRFIQDCKKNNIKVYAVLPNIFHNKTYTENEKKAFENIQKFYKSQDVTFIGDIESGSFYDKKLFYNTEYHLNKTGKRLRTEWFIKNILSLDEIRNGIRYKK